MRKIVDGIFRTNSFFMGAFYLFHLVLAITHFRGALKRIPLEGSARLEFYAYCSGITMAALIVLVVLVAIVLVKKNEIFSPFTLFCVALPLLVTIIGDAVYLVQNPHEWTEECFELITPAIFFVVYAQRFAMLWKKKELGRLQAEEEGSA